MSQHSNNRDTSRHKLTSQQLDDLRHIDLTRILPLCGCTPHPLDKRKWHTPSGTISVNGIKFMNWQTGKGGGGAIDLLCHVKGYDFKHAVTWLADHFEPSIRSFREPSHPLQSPKPLRLPQKDNNNIQRVTQYLCKKRCIPHDIVMCLIHTGTLYADTKANAVFLLLGKGKKVVGAELRGTGFKKWRGMAPGSGKHLGCFYILGKSNRKMILCESAIDAMSCRVLFPEFTAVSTSGAHYNPAWLKKFIISGCEVLCGFDADETGDNLADKMIRIYPSIKRLRPKRQDWNELLLANASL